MRIVKAVWAGGAARILTSAAAFLSLPLAVRYLGPDRYGVWATVTTTSAWINLLDLGVASTLTNQISRAFALDDKAAARRYFTNALLLTISGVVLAGIPMAWCIGRLNWVRLLNVGGNVGSVELKQTIGVAVALVLIALPCNLSAKLLAGYQQLHLSAYAAGAATAASLVALAAGMAFHVGMPMLYLLSMGCFPAASLMMLSLILWRKRWLVPRVKDISFSSAKELLGSGSSFFLIQLAAVVVFSSDNLIVSHYVGASEVTPYSVTWRLASLAACLQTLIFPALWPAYAEAYARGDNTWIRQTFSRMIAGTIALNCLGAAALVAFGRPFVKLWAGACAVPGTSLVVVMAIWTVVSGFMSVESCLLAALDRIRGQAVLSVTAAALNVALSLLLVRYIGATGVILGTVCSYVLVLVVPQTLIVRDVWRTELSVHRGLRRPGSRSEGDCARAGEKGSGTVEEQQDAVRAQERDCSAVLVQ